MTPIPVTPFENKKDLTKYRTVHKEAKERIKGRRFSFFIRTVTGYLVLFSIGIFPLIIRTILHLPAIDNYLKSLRTFLPETIIIIISFISLFAAILLNAGLKAGRESMYWKQSLKLPIRSMWYFCKPSQIFRCTAMWFMLFGIRFAWGALLFSPGLLLILLAFNRSQLAEIYIVVLLLLAAGVLALIAGALVYKFITERYSLVWYFFTDVKKGSAAGAVRLSVKVTEGQCGRALKLSLFRTAFSSCNQEKACFGRNAMNAKGLYPKAR